MTLQPIRNLSQTKGKKGERIVRLVPTDEIPREVQLFPLKMIGHERRQKKGPLANVDATLKSNSNEKDRDLKQRNEKVPQRLQ